MTMIDDPVVRQLKLMMAVSGDRIAELDRKVQVYELVIESLDAKIVSLKHQLRQRWVWPIIALTTACAAFGINCAT